jgi:hypothetical protein
MVIEMDEIREWVWDWQGEMWGVYLVSGITVPCDAIGADNCSEYMNVSVLFMLL